MDLQQRSVEHFSGWQPPPPAVEGRTCRDVTLSFFAGLYGCLGDQLLYKVERKEKIPPWVVVYCGSKTTKTIDNLAPCHPHRFRLQVLIKSTAVANLAETLAQHHGGHDALRNMLAAPDEDGHRRLDDGDSGQVARVPASAAQPRAWLSSLWSAEAWTSTDSGGTSAACFCMAVRCGYFKQVQQMLEERPLLVSVVNCNNGLTPLATAVRRGELSMVKYLVSAGAEVQQPSLAGQTPLHLAVLAANVPLADFLLEKGAHFEARDLNQLRVEHYAVDSCDLRMVQFVLDRGGDVRVRDSNGWTPLFRAVCQGAKTEVIRELVHRGSDVEVSDRAQLTLAAAARLLRDTHGRRRESVLRLVDSQYQHGKVVANFTRLTKKISTFHTLLKQ